MKQNGLTIISKGWGTYANRDKDMYPKPPNWYSPASKCSPLGAFLLDKQIKEAIVCFPENAYIATVCQILKVSYYFANSLHLASIGQSDTQFTTCINQSLQGQKLGIKIYKNYFL